MALAVSLRRQQALVLAMLLVLAAAAWAVVLRQSQGMADMGDHPLDLTMGMAVPVFLATWVVMMVAMMFPASAPMILAFARMQAGRGPGSTQVRTAAFVAAYLLIWLGFGGLAYLLALGLEAVAERSMWFMDNGARVAGALLIGAGLYQASPLKEVCLSRCRNPLSFMLTYWRDGPAGALRMGLQHGLYCLGCCWVLFVVLIPIGLMNVAAMAVVTALVFAEKVLPHGRKTSLAAAATLCAYGLVALAVPAALPTVF